MGMFRIEERVYRTVLITKHVLITPTKTNNTAISDCIMDSFFFIKTIELPKRKLVYRMLQIPNSLIDGTLHIDKR